VKNKRLYARALKLLGLKSRSEAELREKICGDAEEEEVDEVIEECKRHRYLDDRALAEYIVDSSLKKNKGYWYIVSALEKRNIREDIIEEVKDSFDFETEFKKAEEFVCKNREKKSISSLFFSLKSKGFSSPVLSRIKQRYLKRGSKQQQKGE
jgi:SOS response regulatory protein OraA/RecX